ncbi:MAG: hypothetical protein K2X82_08765 [Gemmataceae bacterium]|nr:hypothetical protein [Gemmataceae bacterium]
MSYTVACDCGKSLPVAATDAGASVPCDCGRAVEVPPLHRLRAAAGEGPLSAGVQLRTMLLRGDLPGTDVCAVCGRKSDGLVRVVIHCERAVVKTGADRADQIGCLLLGLLFGWLVLLRPPREYRVLGEDVVFTVPLRVCDRCAPDLDHPNDLRDALRTVPVYTALLHKYPVARVARVG